jgi:hypothetical protein
MFFHFTDSLASRDRLLIAFYLKTQNDSRCIPHENANSFTAVRVNIGRRTG